MIRRARVLLDVAAIFVVAACTTPMPIPPPPADLPGETVVFEARSGGPMCGRCETLKIVAASDGRVWVERGWAAGEQWRRTRELLTVTPERLAAFGALLAP